MMKSNKMIREQKDNNLISFIRFRFSALLAIVRSARALCRRRGLSVSEMGYPHL